VAVQCHVLSPNRDSARFGKVARVGPFRFAPVQQELGAYKCWCSCGAVSVLRRASPPLERRRLPRLAPGVLDAKINAATPAANNNRRIGFLLVNTCDVGVGCRLHVSRASPQTRRCAGHQVLVGASPVAGYVLGFPCGGCAMGYRILEAAAQCIRASVLRFPCDQ